MSARQSSENNEANHSRQSSRGKGNHTDKTQRPVKLLNPQQIMLHLHNEHKYMTKLLNVINEQMEGVDTGNTPSFNIMYEVAHYMNSFSDISHHPREDIIYRKLAERDAGMKDEVENLLIEHEATSKKTESLLVSLKQVMRNPTPEKILSLRFRCDDYVATLNSHMDLEESRVFPRILEVLTSADWADIINEIQPDKDPLFGKQVEKRYQELFDAVSKEVVRATEDFTLAEFIGLGVTMENIGVIATYGHSLGGVVSRGIKQAYQGNRIAYRKLWSARSRSPRDYFSVTIDCLLNNFDTFTDTMRDVSRVLRKARTQIVEPYSSRLRIYHDMVYTTGDEGVNMGATYNGKGE